MFSLASSACRNIPLAGLAYAAMAASKSGIGGSILVFRKFSADAIAISNLSMVFLF